MSLSPLVSFQSRFVTYLLTGDLVGGMHRISPTKSSNQITHYHSQYHLTNTFPKILTELYY